MRMRIFDKQGNPITMERWVELLSTHDYYRVNLTELAKGVTVSTVWLGLDHSFDEETPTIFETMVFGMEDGELQQRYSTEEEALAGHQQMVERVQRECNNASL